MVEFTYKNAKNISIGQTLFELNCDYHSWISYEKNINSRSKSKLVDKVSAKLRKLMIICRKKLYHTQKLQKQAHDKGIKLKNYTFDDKIGLNIRYIKTK